MFYFQAQKKKKIVTKQAASPQILKKKKKKKKQRMASPTDYRGSKPIDSPKKTKPNPNTEQITMAYLEVYIVFGWVDFRGMENIGGKT